MSASSVADSADSGFNLQRPDMTIPSPHRRKVPSTARSDTNDSTLPTPTSTPRMTPTDTDLLLGNSSASESDPEDLDLHFDNDPKVLLLAVQFQDTSGLSP